VIRIAIVGSGLAALSTAIFLEHELRRGRATEPNNDDECDHLENDEEPTVKRRRRRILGMSSSPPPPPPSLSHHRDRDGSAKVASWTVTIYERDESLESRRDGYGLTLKYDPRSVLAKLGILEEICRRDCPSRSHYVLNEKGRVIGYYGNAFPDTAGALPPHPSSSSRRRRGYGQRGNLRVPRQEARRILLEKLQSTKVCWGHRLVRLEEVIDKGTHGGRSRIRCYFENGSSDIADWVVGADGIRSTVLTEFHRLMRVSPPRQSDPMIVPQREASRRPLPPPPSLHWLGVRLIVGLSSLDDSCTTDPRFESLLYERGFYTLGSSCGSRLFVMPFTAPTPLRPNEARRYMWQLSFPEQGEGISDEEDDDEKHRSCRRDVEEGATIHLQKNQWEESGVAGRLEQPSCGNSCTSRELLDEARERCRGWHDPVPVLLQSTPLDTVWSTSLYDRDPGELFEYWRKLRKQRQSSRQPNGARSCLPILVLGDALHAMSCFKGQGAHQALKDGQCVATHLARHLLSRKYGSAASAADACHRELVQRTSRVVLESRRAARDLHRRQTCSSGDTVDNNTRVAASEPATSLTSSGGFAGIRDPAMLSRLIQALESRGIQAGTTHNLDAAVGRVIHDLCLLEREKTTVHCHHDHGSLLCPLSPDPSWTRSAADAARRCDLARLRELSWIAKDDWWMQGPVDDAGNTCLHLAASSAVDIADPSFDDAASSEGRSLGGAGTARAESLQWLVLEAGCSCHSRNEQKQIPVDLVLSPGDEACRGILRDLDHARQR
jgi:2-polyprenyl-6-methoxyphenol hydroxylase-like FAD-dependent oxidoreductase